jgi:transcriptional regulator with XRE-family HTH domain
VITTGFRADLDRTYISGIERGTRNPTVKSILTIAEALATRPSRLISAAESQLRRS